MPKVSVIVPVYNVAEYLPQCLDTILLQTYQDIEVIAIDDGSTDNSLEILQTYTMMDERLKIIHQENAGLGPARNRGLQEATGEYVMFLDSDDFFQLDMIEKMVAKAEEDGSDIVRCSMLLFDNIKEVDYGQKDVPTVEWLTQSPIVPQEHPNDLFFCNAYVWEQMIRRSLIIDSKLSFFNMYQEDIPFTYALMTLANKISILPYSFIHYRKNREGSLIKTHHKNLDISFDPWIRLWENLKKYEQASFFKKSFKNVFTRELSLKFPGIDEPDKKRLLLTLFQEKLDPELQQLFGFGDGKVKISLIVCAYNIAKFLPECLDSCLNQTLKEIEIICVDDGSTDNSLEILNQYAQKDERIKVIHQENQGLPISRNNAIKIATGEYIQFLDADDWIEPDTCACLYLYSKIYNLDMLSFAAIEFKDGTGQEFENPYHCLAWLPKNFISVFTWQQIPDLFPRLAVTSPLTIYRHQYLMERSIYWINKKIAYEDTPFFTEALLKGAKMGVLPIKFYHKRVHETAITSNMDTNFSDYCWIVEYTFNLVQKLSNDTSFLNSFISHYLTKVYLIYQKLSDDARKKMTPSFYKLCYCVISKYHILLSDELNKLCLEYLKNRGIMEKLSFRRALVLAKWALFGYAICPINIVFKPRLTLSFFGFSLFKLKEKTINYNKIFDKFINGHFRRKKIKISDIFESDAAICGYEFQIQNLHILWKEKLIDFNQYVTDFNVALLLGYGNRKPQSEILLRAIKKEIPVVFVEDGFIRSVDTWVHDSIDSKYTSGISFTFSNTVPYFDATHPSLLEKMLNDKKLVISEEQKERARKCIDFIVKNHLTKYNHQPIYTPNIGRQGVQKVLVVDQSYGDFSISKGLANDDTFKIMLERAIKENPEADIIIKTHPDSISSGSCRPKGYYSGYQSHDNVYLLTTPINPISLLEYCDKVYVVTSQLGFEALMCGKEVHTFGMPFYAGWGLTQDHQKCRRRKNKRTLEDMFYITYILYSYYVNPDTQKTCEIEEAMDYLLKLRDEYFKLYDVEPKKS